MVRGASFELPGAHLVSTELTGTFAAVWHRVGVHIAPGMAAAAPDPIGDVVVVGAGVSGIAAGKAFQQHGCRSLTIFEKTGSLGGHWAWPDNYPGKDLVDPSCPSPNVCQHAVSWPEGRRERVRVWQCERDREGCGGCVPEEGGREGVEGGREREREREREMAPWHAPPPLRSTAAGA